MRRTLLPLRRIVGLAAGTVILALAALRGQANLEIRPKKPAEPQETRPEPTLRVETKLVLVPVTVTDTLNRPVVGLEKEHFRVFDDKVEQTITTFSMEDDAVAVGFVFDTSGSMGAGLPAARAATREFFVTGEPDDEYFLVEFDSRPRLVVPLTNSTHQIEYELMYTHSGGSTALLDAVYMALTEMRKSKKTKKAIVIISDGGENHSRYSFTELKGILRETDTLIYSVGAGDLQGIGLLKYIAEQTGGLTFAASMADYSDVAKKIIIDLRNRYVLGYLPTNLEPDGRYHRVHVQLAPPRGLKKIKAHWRMGYYAPEH